MSPVSDTPSAIFLSNLSGLVLFLSRDPVKNFFPVGELFQKLFGCVSPETAKLCRKILAPDPAGAVSCWKHEANG